MVEEEKPVEPKPELTEEERKAKLEELEKLRIKKRKEREEKEKQEELGRVYEFLTGFNYILQHCTNEFYFKIYLEREKRRMEDGKAMSKLRTDIQDQEIKKMAEERKREKLATAEAKRRVMEQIEADKR